MKEKSRGGYEEGYDFVLFAPLAKPPAVPKWLSKNRIWIGLERWGIEDVASIIEARIQEAGGNQGKKRLNSTLPSLAVKLPLKKQGKKSWIRTNEKVLFIDLSDFVGQHFSDGWRFTSDPHRPHPASTRYPFE